MTSTSATAQPIPSRLLIVVVIAHLLTRPQRLAPC
jgi:hypothetical protein